MLNPHQQQAAEHFEGPLLVLAGAGSGKTSVLTQRVAHLVDYHRVYPSQILVVTFTNKAAKEMKARLIKLIGEGEVNRLWVGTFHAICSRLLRQDIHHLGYDRRFVIYDPDDQKKAMRNVIEKLNLDPKQYHPVKMLGMVSKSKNSGQPPGAGDFSLKGNRHADIYQVYQQYLKDNNALDFDDLLLLTLKLLQQQPDVLDRYQRHFRYILVDEYQDTNSVQFDLITLLGQSHRNVFVVGDVDQSIYSFRHADFRIILRFQQDYPDARVVKLEDNYRSTSRILDASNAVIAHNRERFDKTLLSTRGEGEHLRYYCARDGEDEVQYIINHIMRMKHQGVPYGNIAVLYRTNAQSRLFEQKLVRSGIPHILVGAFRFYERKEIKDLIAYLHVLYNPFDQINFKRILNTPKRGIGAKTIEQFEQLAEQAEQTLWEALQNPMVLAQLGAKARKTLTELASWLLNMTRMNLPMFPLIEMIYLESGYKKELYEQDEEEIQKREENINAFLQAAREFEERQNLEGKDGNDLGEFLNHIALISDVDGLKDDGGSVTLMTVHSAKGLEFPIVFVTGLEEGTFPHSRSIMEQDMKPGSTAVEEERRLMYVAMTRAKDLLFLTHARQRMGYEGFAESKDPSRFLAEVPSEFLDTPPANALKTSFLPGHSPSSRGQWPGSSAKPMKTVAAKAFTPPKPDFSFKAEPPRTYQSSLKLQKGDQVRHSTWGLGQVEDVKSSGSKQIAIIIFPGQVGKRVLDPAIAPLEKV